MKMVDENNLFPEVFMEFAINKAKEGIEKGQTPFGACIVKGGNIISCEHNNVWNNMDITAHAEINAIRKACEKLGTIDLCGCTIYSTCEPCPMCFSACHWAKISTVVYGASIKDAKEAGFNELCISTQRIKDLGDSQVKIIKNSQEEDCLELFSLWKKKKNNTAY